ncbi:MAG: DUF1003 domain-containing protein [candidate division SR1 bacterium]|nr:DUF1003 domain-containing protein [candidate division SR1 bacterium]
MPQKPADRFMSQEAKKINKMNQLVADAIKNNENITQTLLEASAGKLTLGQRMADGVASFGGSWRFIIIFGVILLLRILTNAMFLANRGWDPYPFILLNLVLSCLAAIQAPIIMMSQNRKEEIDRKRAEDDYIINLKAETQIRNMDEKINILVIEQMKKMFKLQEGQLELLEEIKKIVKK